MPDYSDFFNIAMDALKKLLYPEEWMEIDSFLPKAELFTLMQLDRNGEIMMSQMADYVNVPMSTATGLVERLVRKGLVERDRSNEDRRIVTIRLTAEGRKLAENIKQTVTGYMQAILDELTEEEGELLRRIFFKVTDIWSRKAAEQKNPDAEGGTLKKIEIE